MTSSKKLHGEGRRRPTFKWTHVHRVALHLMHDAEEGFALPQRTIEVVFRSIFREDIFACDLKDLAPASLKAQYREATTKPNAWAAILHPADTPSEKNLRRRLRDSIANAVREGNPGSNTIESPCQGPVPTTPPPRPRKQHTLLKKADARVLPRRKATRALSPVVMVASTPSKAPATVLVNRRYGGDVKAPKDKYKPRWDPPSPERVQPPSEFLPHVFFRFWLEGQEHCRNSADGFGAGFFLDANVMPDRPYRVEQIENTRLFYHVEGLSYRSPWVSTSSCLVWTLNNAIKTMKDNPDRKMNFSVIAREHLDPAGIYYFKPFMAPLKNYYPFTKGKWMYGGSYEWLVYDQVPKRAMISTSSLEGFLASVNNASNIARIIQLPVLFDTADTMLMHNLRQSSPELDKNVAFAVGDCIQLLGLTASSSVEQLSSMVAELVAGFAVKITRLEPSEWTNLAAFFAHSFTAKSREPIDINRQLLLQQSFILGCQLGLRNPSDKDLAAQGTVPILRKLKRKQLSVGLEGAAATMLYKDMGNVEAQLIIHQKRYERRFNALPGQLLVEDGVIEDNISDDQNDQTSTFELDEDGMVV